MRSSFLSLTALVTVLLTLSPTNQAHAQAQACNGYAELCSKPYNQVTYATTHNAYAFSPPGALAANQDNDIPTQLKDGIRAFMLDAYAAATPSDIQLCHGNCQLLNGGPLSKTLGLFKTFMDANPNEVITILWENAGKLPPSQFQTVYQAAGLADYLHTQEAGNTNWPTLGEMISSGKRLVNFLDDGYSAGTPWLMNEYSFMFETPWHIPKGTPYQCTIDRPKGGSQQSMYVLNHFISGQISNGGQSIDIPQKGAAAQTNGAELVNHVNDCVATFNQNPTFLAVDFYDQGNLLQTVAQVNGVTYTGKGATRPKTGNDGTAMVSSSKTTMAAVVGAIAGALLLA
ncbi:hypothetical protein BGZ73_000646 [Actinomortierella ambigua]|nr:hypothetical protein BGZ73_000646 [Actinomortierella ambigua]